MMPLTPYKILEEALQFLRVTELKDLLVSYGLSVQGKKGDMIGPFLYFLKTEKLMDEPLILPHCCAEKEKNYPLHLDTLILKGSYKNDLKTRLFFKKMIGPHFHFTAFGHDWIRECWRVGRAPTYGEFSEMWKYEYDQRSKTGSQPKREWAYIRFVKDLMKKSPKISRILLLKMWEEERKKQKHIAHEILKKYNKVC